MQNKEIVNCLNKMVKVKRISVILHYFHFFY